MSTKLTIEEYFGDWMKVIDKNELLRVMRILDRIYAVKSVCPNKCDVFKAFSLLKLQDLKIVFIGQDPYPQKDVATGILFGNKEGTEMSPSLKIIKEASVNFEIPHNNIIFDPTLESWAKQGILMINSAFTVEMNKVGSHTMLWRPFVSKLLINLSKYDTGIIYVLFGQQAATFTPYISKFNIVLSEYHPAYYARINNKMPSKVFEEINKLCKGKYGTSIKWYQEY